MTRTKTDQPLATCLCGCGLEVTRGRSYRQGHDQILRGKIVRGEADLRNSAVRAFAKRHGLVKAKPATTRKARTKATTA